jgi:tRNA(fMet)-specific endonuclease VapC
VTYLLDTDICSFVMKRRFPALVERVRRFGYRELTVSAVTAFELEFGARRSGRYEALMRVISAFLDNVEVLPFDHRAAGQAGAIRADLAAENAMIGAYDLLIAGHARASRSTLVTNNVREFSRVRDLQVENWADER